MKRVIVTGADGFIGSALVRSLIANDYQVYAVVKDKEYDFGSINSKIEIIPCSFSQYHTLAELINESIDCFIHLAWRGVSGQESQDVVCQGENIRVSTIALEQAHLLNAKKFIFAGSSYQYRMEPVIEANEKIFKKINIYGKAKEAATLLLKAAAAKSNMGFNSVLFTNVFGIGDFSHRSTNTMILQLLNCEPLRLISGEHKHDWIYIEDAVNGIISVMEKGKNSISYYIGNRQLRTFMEIIRDVRDTLSSGTELEFGYYPDDGYIDYSEIDLEGLYRDTGFECKTDFCNSIRKTAQWLAEQKGKEGSRV